MKIKTILLLASGLGIFSGLYGEGDYEHCYAQADLVVQNNDDIATVSSGRLENSYVSAMELAQAYNVINCFEGTEVMEADRLIPLFKHLDDLGMHLHALEATGMICAHDEKEESLTELDLFQMETSLKLAHKAKESGNDAAVYEILEDIMEVASDYFEHYVVPRAYELGVLMDCDCHSEEVVYDEKHSELINRLMKIRLEVIKLLLGEDSGDYRAAEVLMTELDKASPYEGTEPCEDFVKMANQFVLAKSDEMFTESDEASEEE